MPATYLELHSIAGPSIEDAIIEGCRVASMLRVYVKIDINGIETLIAPDDPMRVIHNNYMKARDRGAKFVSANVIPDPSLAHQ